MHVLKIVSEDTVEPLDVADVVENLHADPVNDATRLTNLIKAARRAAEQFTGVSIIKRTVELARRDWRCSRIPLEYGPVGDVVSVIYTDEDGDAQTLATDQYRVNRYVDPPLLIPAYDVTWPTVRCDVDAVKVQWKVGFANTGAPVPTVIPDDVKQALHLYVGHYFANREAVGPAVLAELPLGARALLEPYRVMGV